MKKVFLKNITKALAAVMIIGTVFVGCRADADRRIDDLNADVIALKAEVAQGLANLKTELQTAINNEVTRLNDEIAGLKTKISSLEGDIAALETEMATKATKEELAEAKADLIAQIEAAKAEILSKTVSLEAFEAYKKDVAAQIKALEDELAKKATKAEVQEMETRLNAQILEVSTALGELGGRLDLVSQNLEKTVGDLARLQGTVDARIKLIDGILQIKNGKSETIADIYTQLADQLEKIEANTDSIILLRTDLGKVIDRLEVLEALDIAKRLEYLEGLDIENRLNYLEGLDIENRLDSLEKYDKVLDAKIATLNTRIDSLVAAVASNDEDIADIYLEIDGLKDRVKALEDYRKDVLEPWKEEYDEWKPWVDSELERLSKEVAILNANMKVIAEAMSLNFQALSSRLTGLTFVAEYYVNGIPAMDFSPLKTGKTCQNTITPDVQIAYHLSPSFITKDDIDVDNMRFIVIKNTRHRLKFLPGKTSQNEVEAKFVDIVDGKLIVKVGIEDLDAVFADTKTFLQNLSFEETFPSVVLQVPLSEKAITENKLQVNDDNSMEIITINGEEFYEDWVVTASHYVRLDYNQYVAMEDVVLGLNDRPENTYPLLTTTVADAIALEVENIDGGAVTDETVIYLPYNIDADNLSDTIHLADTVAAILLESPTVKKLFDVEKYDLKFNFDLLDENGEVFAYDRHGVDQQKFVEIVDAARGTITATPTTKAEIALSQGRTPIVRATMYHGDNIECPILWGFVKIAFEEQPPIRLTYTWEETVAPCDTTDWELPFTWMTENVFDSVGLSAADFYADTRYGLTFTATGDSLVTATDLPDRTLNWEITPQAVWAKLNANPDAAEVSFKATVTFKSQLHYVDPDIIITFNKVFTRPVDEDLQNILPGELVTKYWYNLSGVKEAGVFEEIKSNVNVPDVNDNTPIPKNVYETNITGAFVSNADKSLKGYDNYQFFFIEDQKTHYIDGEEITLVAADNGQTLRYGSVTGEVVARIHLFAATIGDIIELNNASNIAKRLLNNDREFLRATLGLRYNFCPDLVDAAGEPVPTIMPVKIVGNETFDVVFVRPITANANAAKEFIDGKLYGQVGTYMTIKDLANLEDWRGVKLTSGTNLYGYYGITAITVNKDDITTNVNGEWEPLANYPQLEVTVVPPGGSIPGVTPVDPLGYLTYVNNGMVIGGDFELKVPVTVKHHWGDLKSAVVTVTVKKTMGPSGVIRR